MGVIARDAVRDAERCGFHQGQRLLTPPHQQAGYMTAYLTLPDVDVPLATEGPSIHGSISRAIDTPMQRSGMTAAGLEAARTRIPLGRMGLAAECARGAVFLASDLGSYVTGHVLAVDGGFLMR